MGVTFISGTPSKADCSSWVVGLTQSVEGLKRAKTDIPEQEGVCSSRPLDLRHCIGSLLSLRPGDSYVGLAKPLQSCGPIPSNKETGSVSLANAD